MWRIAWERQVPWRLTEYERALWRNGWRYGMADDVNETDTPNAPYIEKDLYNQLERTGSVGMGLGNLRVPTARQQAQVRLAELRKQVKAHEEFIEELDKNPQTEQLLNKMRKLGL